MLSITLRQSLQKLLLPVYLFFAMALMIIGISAPSSVEGLRVRVFDFLTPAYSLAAQPGRWVGRFWSYASDVTHLLAENAELRTENARLRQWYDVATALEDENRRLKANLKWLPERTISFVTGRAIRDASGLYNRSVLIALPEVHEVHIGDLVLGGTGVIGRISEIGPSTARVLLINDPVSRIPVFLSSSEGSAIMTGDGSATPRLMYFAYGDHPVEGERVVTGDQAGQENAVTASGVPNGVFIGVVHYNASHTPVVIPGGHLNHPDVLRVLDFKEIDAHGPVAPGRVRKINKARDRFGFPESIFPNVWKGQG